MAADTAWRHQIVEMAAESSEYPKSDEAMCTEECTKVWDVFDEAAYDALQKWVDIHPGALVKGENENSLWFDEGPYLIYMTMAGHGVGIWDGSWDNYFRDRSVIRNSLQPFLDKELSKKYQKLETAIFNAAYETTRISEHDVEDLASKLSDKVNGSEPVHIGEHRWSDKNDSAYFVTHTPEYGVRVVVLVSVFEDDDIAIDFFGSENMSETERWENIIHFLYDDVDIKEMTGDINEVLETIDGYQASWEE